MTSKLFPVPLIGAGTAEVESFASYLHRSSIIHGVNVGVLLRYIHSQSVADSDKHGSSNGWILHNYLRPHELVCPNEMSWNLVEAMGGMSGQSLAGGILWFLSSVLGRSSGEICEGFRWCPECFAEISAVEGVPYFKLIWHVKDIDCCPIHRTPFVSACSECGCDQTSYIKTAPLGICQGCGASLSKRKDRLNMSDIKHSWNVSGLDVLTLFEDLSSISPDSLPEDGVRKSIEKLFDFYWSQNREDELYKVLPRDKLLSVIHNLRAVSFKVARRFAYRMGLSLYDLMSGNVLQATAVGDESWFCSLPPSFTRASSREKHDHKAILKRARRYLRGCDTPPSLKQVARELGLSVGYLEYRFPVLSKKIVTEHSDFVSREKLKRIYRAQEAALRYFCALSLLEKPSRKRAYKELRCETQLPKFLLKRAIQTAYSAIYGGE